MIKITTFYSFFYISENQLNENKKKLVSQGEEKGIRGLILISSEGINGTISGNLKALESYKKELNNLFNQDFNYKDSFSEKWNFKRLSVKIKKEIIKAKKQNPRLEKEGHFSPEEWEAELKKDVQILDIRNNYETKVGKFKKAYDLNLSTFQEFSKKLKEASLKKNKKTMIYCTGGIRCEKAIKIMKEQGFKEVYQLNGGILNYLKHYPNSQFQDECFVFDHRVSVNQNLKPSQKYSLCPHCGQSASVEFNCSHCEKPFLVCSECLNKKDYVKTCSKNCSYHFKKGHVCRKKYKQRNPLPHHNKHSDSSFGKIN